VHIYELPENIRAVQVTAVRRTLHHDTINTIKTIYMHICMACVANNRICLDTKMRMMADGRASCTSCLNQGCVVSVCVFGRIVRIKQSSFFYCPTCMRVHAWKSTGSEFTYCPLKLAKTTTPAPSKCCRYCTRTNSIETISVLDDEKAAIQEVMLCSRHMPLEHSIPYIDNLHCLRLAVKEKISLYGSK